MKKNIYIFLILVLFIFIGLINVYLPNFSYKTNSKILVNLLDNKDKILIELDTGKISSYKGVNYSNLINLDITNSLYYSPNGEYSYISNKLYNKKGLLIGKYSDANYIYWLKNSKYLLYFRSELKSGYKIHIVELLTGKEKQIKLKGKNQYISNIIGVIE